jgi:hypothetical protein
MPLSPGTVLGAYEVIAPIGAGGMGEVYRARDSRLKRDVALKVLPADLATDESRVRRFGQEARATAALSHPNILAVFDIGLTGDVLYVISELLEGGTLREAIASPVTPARACAWAVQVAHGLAAAHAKEIVHRDIKPENLFITTDGRVKILDFGLARVGPPASADSTTRTSAGRHTEDGMVLGTIGYLSPEQARGLPADARSDVFSLGVVMYEMLSGRSPFAAASAVESMHATLTLDPPEFDAARGVPPTLERVVRRCLEKRPDDRFHSAHDLALALEAAGGSSARVDAPAAHGPARASWAHRFTVAALVLAAGAVGAGATYFLARPNLEPPAFQRMTFRRGTLQSARFEPGTRNVVYSARWQSEPAAMFSGHPYSPESKVIGQSDALVLAISPNQQAAVLLQPRLSSTRIIGTLATMPLGGGGAKELLTRVLAADFMPDGQLAATEYTGDTSKVHRPVGNVIHQTRDLLVSLRVSPGGLIAVNSPTKLFLLDAGGAVMATIDTPGISGIAWHPDREELWYSVSEGRGGAAIFAITPDASRRLVWRGRAMALQDITSDGAALVIARDTQGGVLVQHDASRETKDLAWFDNSTVLAISPAGDALLVTEGGDSGSGVYMRKLDGSPAVKLGEGLGHSWSPDGDRVLIAKTPNQFEMVPVGAGLPKTIDHPNVWSYFAWFHPDGKRLLINGRIKDEPYRFWWMDESGATTEAGPAGLDHWAGQEPLSNDGRMIAAFKSGQQTTRTVTVYPLDGGAPIPVAGMEPNEVVIRFSEDDRHLLVYDRDRLPARIYKLDYRTGTRALWRELDLADPAGVAGFHAIAMTRTGSVVAYNYIRSLGTAFLVTGLK